MFNDWSTLKKLIWLVGSAVVGGEDRLITLTGSLVRFASKSSKPFVKTEVAVEPAQDLHGYDAPWPGGGGKNLFNIADAFSGTGQSISGTTISKDSTGYYFDLLNGTAGSSSIAEKKIALSAGTYTISGTYTGTGLLRVHITDSAGTTEATYVAGISSSIASQSFTLATDGYITLRYSARAEASVANLQIEAGSSATAYAPYSNLCPISGWTEANVYDEAVYDASATPKKTITFPQTAQPVYGANVTVNEDGSGTLSVDQVKYTFVGTEQWGLNGTTDAKAYYYANVPDSIVVGDCLCSHISQTTLSVNNTAEGANFQRVSNNDSFLIRLPESVVARRSTSAFKTWLSDQNTAGTPLEAAATLATPIEYTLTAEQTGGILSTLQGENNVWADTGNVTVQVYGVEIVEPDATPLQALNLLLGGAYHNNQTQEDVPDAEALNIILGGTE